MADVPVLVELYSVRTDFPPHQRLLMFFFLVAARNRQYHTYLLVYFLLYCTLYYPLLAIVSPLYYRRERREKRVGSRSNQQSRAHTRSPIGRVPINVRTKEKCRRKQKERRENPNQMGIILNQLRTCFLAGERVTRLTYK
jgi:hypothetical protein